MTVTYAEVFNTFPHKMLPDPFTDLNVLQCSKRVEINSRDQNHTRLTHQMVTKLPVFFYIPIPATGHVYMTFQ